MNVGNVVASRQTALRARRSESRQSALGPISAICDDLYKSRLSGFSWWALNVVNWAESGTSAFVGGAVNSSRFTRSVARRSGLAQRELLELSALGSRLEN